MCRTPKDGGRCPGAATGGCGGRSQSRPGLPGPHKCPFPARFRAGILHFFAPVRHAADVPGAEQVHDELVAHLTRTSPLSPGEAARVVAEVLGYFSESAEEYVRRRHRELKAEGLTNDQAFGRIAAELPARRVTAPPFSQRQLRRVVYG